MKSKCGDSFELCLSDKAIYNHFCFQLHFSEAIENSRWFCAQFEQKKHTTKEKKKVFFALLINQSQIQLKEEHVRDQQWRFRLKVVLGDVLMFIAILATYSILLQLKLKGLS